MPNTRRGGFPPRSRRISDWGLGPASVNGSISASGKLLWSLATTPSQNLTLIRTRGEITYYLSAATAAVEGYQIASGIYMMTEDAFAIGATAALDPLSDANSDMWLWHRYADLRAITGTIADGVNAVACCVRQEIDSKAMRKDFDPERVMVGVTGAVESGTAVLRVHAECRQLFKT